MYFLHKCMLSRFSHVWLFATLWTVTCQSPLSMGFCRQEYWSGLPFPSPGDLPNPGIFYVVVYICHPNLPVHPTLSSPLDRDLQFIKADWWFECPAGSFFGHFFFFFFLFKVFLNRVCLRALGMVRTSLFPSSQMPDIARRLEVWSLILLIPELMPVWENSHLFY